MAPAAFDTLAGNLAGGAIVGNGYNGVLPVAPILGSRDVDNCANTFVVGCLATHQEF
jgi:hypothetical protein